MSSDDTAQEETEKVTIYIRCTECKGSGVYSGYSEPEGTGVVCMRCEGSGRKKFSYTPFTERATRSDINVVFHYNGPRDSDGRRITEGNAVTYKVFLEGKMPKEAV